MIVQPDFPDHWKTEMLVQLSGGEESVRSLLRFWAHCQQRRCWKFTKLTPVILAGICKWKGEPQKFWDAMLATFLVEKKGTFTAHQWDEINATLIGRWKGGKHTQDKWKAKAKPKLSQGDKSREDKIREEEIEKIYAAYPLKRAKPDAVRAIKKAAQKHKPDFLLSKTQAYSSVRNGDLSYVPNPATWFNQERFNDDPSTWKANNGANKGHTAESNRNLGTANEGRSSQYAGVGKI